MTEGYFYSGLRPSCTPATPGLPGLKISAAEVVCSPNFRIEVCVCVCARAMVLQRR